MTRVLAVVALVVALAGCGSESSARDELTDHPAPTCPATLPIGDDPGGHGFGVEDDATRSPDLPEVETAWICRYDPVDGASAVGGADLTWTLAGAAAPVGRADVPVFSTALDELAPRTPGEHACPADLGPRWLVTWTTGRDLTGAVVEGYGCADVRLSDEPSTAPAGATSGGGTVPGVLPAPTSLLRAIQAVVGDRARFHALLAVDGGLDLPCAEAERQTTDLDVPGPGRSSPEEAAAPYADGDRLALRSSPAGGDTAEVDVIGADGVVRRIVSTSHHRDGWWPDGYVGC